MILYTPVYENGRHTCRAFESKKARFYIGNGWGRIFAQGTTFCPSLLFSNPDAVAAWWNKQFHISEKYRIDPAGVEFQTVEKGA